MQYTIRIEEKTSHILTVEASDEFDALDQSIIVLRAEGVRNIERDPSRYSGVSITSIEPIRA